MGTMTRHRKAMTGTAQKPTAATSPCHLPRDSEGAISAIYACEQTIRQKTPKPVMARKNTNTGKLSSMGRPLMTEQAENKTMENKKVFRRPMMSEMMPPRKPPEVMPMKYQNRI